MCEHSALIATASATQVIRSGPCRSSGNGPKNGTLARNGTDARDWGVVTAADCMRRRSTRPSAFALASLGIDSGEQIVEASKDTTACLPAVPVGQEAATRLAAVMERLAAFPMERALAARYVAKRDGSWDELFRAIEALEASTARLEAAP